MTVGCSDPGIGFLRRAMAWMLGCFSSRKEKTKSQHKNKIFATASKAFRRGSSRRDKAQVLPDTTVFSQDDKVGRKSDKDVRTSEVRDQEVTAREELTRSKCVDEVVNRKVGSREDEHANQETVAQLNGSRQLSKIENGESSSCDDTSVSPAEKSRSCWDKEQEYLSIDAVFAPGSFVPDDKENHAAEDFLSSQGDLFGNHQQVSLLSSVENLPNSRCSKNSLGQADDEDRASFSSGKKSFSQHSFDDKPIMGLVTAEWVEEPKSVSSYKTWDGKGIPNSTSKYKEDQTVSFQTTPFETRLERALASQV